MGGAGAGSEASPERAPSSFPQTGGQVSHSWNKGRVAPRMTAGLTPGGPVTSNSLSCFPACPTPRRRALPHPRGHSERVHTGLPSRPANHSGELATEGSRYTDILRSGQTVDQVISVAECLQGPTQLFHPCLCSQPGVTTAIFLWFIAYGT